MADIPTTAFVTAPNTSAGQPAIQLLDPTAVKPTPPNTLAPITPPAPPPNILTIVANINLAIAGDRAANTPGGTTPLAPPDNFAFTDTTVNVSGTTPGDAFKGAIADIKSQFIDITPDNLLIRATSPGAFISSGPGNDVLIAAGGHNILDAGSGQNVFIGAAGADTFILDMTKAGGTALVQNARSGDDVVFFGGNVQSFGYSITDSILGLEISVTGKDAAASRSSEILLPGYTIADLGTKLSVGLTSTADGAFYGFVHVT